MNPCEITSPPASPPSFANPALFQTEAEFSLVRKDLIRAVTHVIAGVVVLKFACDLDIPGFHLSRRSQGVINRQDRQTQSFSLVSTPR